MHCSRLRAARATDCHTLIFRSVNLRIYPFFLQPVWHPQRCTLLRVEPGNLAPTLFHRWLHRSADMFSDVFRPRDLPHQSYEHMAIFCNPEVVSAYVERLETTTLPFAIDAAHIINVVPPRKEEEYMVLDDACGTGAAVEWIIKEFEEEDLDIDITATDTSAVMINEVTKRRERLNWGDNVKFVIMDAQV